MSNTEITDEVNVIEWQNMNNHINIKMAKDSSHDTKYTDIHEIGESVCDAGPDETTQAPNQSVVVSYF